MFLQCFSLMQLAVHASAPATCKYPCEACSQGSNLTAACDKLFVDVGANTGQTLRAWYDGNRRWDAALAKVMPLAARQHYCADIIEASPSFSTVLLKEANLHRNSRGGAHCACPSSATESEQPTCRCGCSKTGKDVQLYLGTPFSAESGDVTFQSLGFVHDAGGTLSFDATSVKRLPAQGKAKLITLQSLNAVEYLRSKTAVKHLVLKIDVEAYEFRLLPALITSGALCDPRRKTDLLLEWHTNRYYGAGPMFNETQMGIPQVYSRMPNGELDVSYGAKNSLLWMLRSPACRTVRVHEDWH